MFVILLRRQRAQLFLETGERPRLEDPVTPEDISSGILKNSGSKPQVGPKLRFGIYSPLNEATLPLDPLEKPGVRLQGPAPNPLKDGLGHAAFVYEPHVDVKLT